MSSARFQYDSNERRYSRNAVREYSESFAGRNKRVKFHFCVKNTFEKLLSGENFPVFIFSGSGNGSECRKQIEAQINKTSCAGIKDCSFDGVYQPKPIPSSIKFVGISNGFPTWTIVRSSFSFSFCWTGWFATFSTLAKNLTVSKDEDGNFHFPSIALKDIRDKISQICEQPWGNLPSPDKYRSCSLIENFFFLIEILIFQLFVLTECINGRSLSMATKWTTVI